MSLPFDHFNQERRQVANGLMDTVDTKNLTKNFLQLHHGALKWVSWGQNNEGAGRAKAEKQKGKSVEKENARRLQIP